MLACRPKAPPLPVAVCCATLCDLSPSDQRAAHKHYKQAGRWCSRHSSMESALERRERLKALRAAAQAAEAQQQPAATAAPEAGTQQQEAAPEPEQPVLKFRSYVLKDQKIAHEKVCLLFATTRCCIFCSICAICRPHNRCSDFVSTCNLHMRQLRPFSCIIAILQQPHEQVHIAQCNHACYLCTAAGCTCSAAKD